MGFSWSLYYCQLIVEARLGSLDLFAGSRLLSDRGGSPVLDVVELQRAGRAPKSNWEPPLFHYAYVDNIGVFTKTAPDATSALEHLQRNFERDGLLLHEVEVREQGGDTLASRLGHVEQPRRPPRSGFAFCAGPWGPSSRIAPPQGMPSRSLWGTALTPP